VSTYLARQSSTILIDTPPASAYTEMNAVTKGASIGIYPKGKAKNLEAVKDGSQPYVDLMGRKYVSAFQYHHITYSSQTNK
jgi:hypothetical protein